MEQRASDAATPGPAPVTLEDLAEVVLAPVGSERLRAVRHDLGRLGPEAFGAKHPELDDAFADGGPSDVQLLLGVGQQTGTIVSVDWSAEEHPGATRELLTVACEQRGLVAPAWDGETESRILDALGDHAERGAVVPLLLRALDEQLRASGLRLLLIDVHSDTYHLVPVTGEDFVALVGRAGDGFAVRGAGVMTGSG